MPEASLKEPVGPHVTPAGCLVLGDGLQVTPRVHKRLEREARQATPKDFLAKVAPLLLWAIVISALVIDIAWGFVLGWIPALLVYMVCRAPWERRVSRKTKELASTRQERIAEAQAFYASAEWRRLRQQILREEPHVCSLCGRTLKREGQLAVDHIKPRSKYPELSLARDNLQILCVKCNSSKGDLDLF